MTRAFMPVRILLGVVIIGLTFNMVFGRQIYCTHAVSVALFGVKLFTSIIIVLALVPASKTNLLAFDV